MDKLLFLAKSSLYLYRHFEQRQNMSNDHFVKIWSHFFHWLESETTHSHLQTRLYPGTIFIVRQHWFKGQFSLEKYVS